MYYQETFAPDEIIIYLRKSRSDDPLLSVEEVLKKHEKILNDYALRTLGEPISENNIYREVASSETIDERPEMLHVLKLIESPKIKAVLVVEVQRLSRGDLEDAGRLMKLFRYTNTKVITPQKTYNLHDEYDRDSFERELKRGNDYLEYTKKILSRGRLLSVSQGNYIGSIPPYGYDKVWITDGKQKFPTLAENKEQADIVRMIFDLYVNQDMGRNNICNYLDSLGIAPPKGKYWSPPALKDMLENVHYIGKVKWNRRKIKTIVEDSELIKTRPKAKAGDFLIFDGKHDAIISEELFQAAQDKQGRNHRAKAKTKIRNPLAGLLFCSCGRSMSLRTYKDTNGTERSAPRLLCDGQTHCNTGSCLFSEMIDSLSSILKESIDNFEINLKNKDNNNIKLQERMIQTLEKKLKDLEAKELAQWEAQSDPDPANRMPQEIFIQLNQKLLKEKNDVQQALIKAYEEIPEYIDYEEKILRFQAALFSLSNDDISAEEKNRLLKSCVERINYTREKPQRIKREPGEKKGSRLKRGGAWTSPAFNIDVKLSI